VIRRVTRRVTRPLTARLLIILATTGSLVLAFVLTAFWFTGASGSGRLEPAAEALGLLAGISGVVAERRAATRERRAQALAAVRDELDVNHAVLDLPPFAPVVPGAPGGRPVRQVYRRLLFSAVDAALLSAVLSPSRDGELTRLLRDWRNQVEVFNQQLSLAEILAFTTDSAQVQAVLDDLHDGLHGPDGPLVGLRARLATLRQALDPAA